MEGESLHIQVDTIAKIPTKADPLTTSGNPNASGRSWFLETWAVP